MAILKRYKIILITVLSLFLTGCHHWFFHGGGHRGHGGHGRHFSPHSMNQIDIKNPLVKASRAETPATPTTPFLEVIAAISRNSMPLRAGDSTEDRH